jgi:hypothetical protein
MEKHETREVETYERRGNTFQAACSCGWCGQRGLSVTESEWEADAHVAQTLDQRLRSAPPTEHP